MAHRKTKIIATLGPASEDPQTVRRLVDAGMDVVRLNFSHGSHASHRRLCEEVRRAAEEAGRPVAVLQDVQGPKIRVGSFPGGEAELEEGQSVELRPGEERGGDGVVYVDYPHLMEDLEPGQPVVLMDGLIRLEVTGRAARGWIARVFLGGTLRDHQGAAFPESALKIAALTSKDRVDLEFGEELEVDLVAVSFVRNAADMEQTRRLTGNRVPLIAKIELAAAVENLQEILEASEGAMVARGDLGVELPLERLPRVQSEILAATNRCGGISITATEMLESMTQAPRPTRAEVTDVASAVLAGTDAVMLSKETATGRYPVRSVGAMDSICREVESGPAHAARPPTGFLTGEEPIPAATTKAAVEAAGALDLRTIIAFTTSGATARLLSKYRPKARILAFTPEREVWRRMSIYWGVEPRTFERQASTDEMLAHAERSLLQEGLCEPGETVLMVAGIPPHRPNVTNFMKLHRVGSAKPMS